MNANDKITAKMAMQLIPNISQSSAYRYIEQARCYFKVRRRYLSVARFCQYYGIDYK